LDDLSAKIFMQIAYEINDQKKKEAEKARRKSKKGK